MNKGGNLSEVNGPRLYCRGSCGGYFLTHMSGHSMVGVIIVTEYKDGYCEICFKNKEREELRRKLEEEMPR